MDERDTPATGVLPGGRPADRSADRTVVVWVSAGALAWALTRALVVWLLLDRHAWVAGDLAYFDQSLAAVPDLGLASTLVEYPLPGVLVVVLPGFLAALVGAPGAYAETVLVLSLLADAAFAVLLALLGGRRRRTAATVWILAVPLLGATTYARFDLVPGVLVGVALLVWPRRPRLAAAAGAVATGLKLWPALVLPALAAPAATRRVVTVVVAVVGGLLATASLVVAGWDRLVSPLTWQAERGLQIESVAASPAMVAWAMAPDRYAVGFTEHNAYEVAGPGVGELLAVAETVSLLLVAGLLGLWLLAFRRGRDLGPDAVVWLALAAVAAFVVTSKVLSPQYLLWLLPLASAAVAVSGERSVRLWTVLLLVATASTQLVFPELYGNLTADGAHKAWTVLVLVVRNALLVWLTAWAVACAVGAVSGAGRSSATHPDRRGATRAPSGGGPTTRA
jgi:hypothetical protein